MKLDPHKTALLAMDFQKGIIGNAPGSETAVANAAKAAELGRKRGYLIIHIGVGFSEGYPEIPDNHPVMERAKKNNLFMKGGESAAFHPSIMNAGELIIYKQRYSAFSENNMHLILRARLIENLVLCGIATSGVVLSTLRRAYDLDYRCTVLKDACFDRDPEVHRVLTEKIFPAQATVTTVEAFAAEY